MWPSGSDFQEQRRKDEGVIPYIVSLLFLHHEMYKLLPSKLPATVWIYTSLTPETVIF